MSVFPKRELPISLTLVTRHGFSKHIKASGKGSFRDLREVILIPILENMGSPIEMPMPEEMLPTSAVVRQIEFRLERYRTVKQKNGKEHIVAVYKELP